MQSAAHIAKATVRINGSATMVWNALTEPALIEKYMMGSKVISDWKEGSSITWKGEWKGKPYEDKGTILQLKPGTLLSYSHYSPLSGLPDTPENYHTVTIELAEAGESTSVSLSQNNNPTEEARQHSEKNWKMMLDGLKKLVEDQG
jgi:uncharacterized protein YndB with AHSA1/START domain